jgi:hypothetical protein
LDSRDNNSMIANNKTVDQPNITDDSVQFTGEKHEEYKKYLDLGRADVN